MDNSSKMYNLQLHAFGKMTLDCQLKVIFTLVHQAEQYAAQGTTACCTEEVHC